LRLVSPVMRLELKMPENRPADANAVARSLSELTAGWAAVPGVDPATLDAARAALASSVLAVPPGVDLRAPQLGAPGAATAPSLETELLQIAQRAGQAAAQPDGAPAAPTTIAVVRSPSGASTTNPAGIPDWARGGQVIDSYGPFQDATGALHWVDLLPVTVSAPVQFAGAAAPFAVVPVRREIGPPILHPPLPQPPPNELELGAGSVWFLASLLGTAFEAGAFTGFTITGGTLLGTQSFTFANGVYEAPAGSALTLTVSLAPAAQAVTGAVAGPDAAAATATPPAEVVIGFTGSSATLQLVADAQAQAYGDSVTLHWAGAAPVPSSAGLPEVLIPGTASPASFGFTHAASQVFAPSGSAPITGAGWALPLAATAITALPEAAGPGVCELHLGSGAELVTEIDGSTAVPIASWLLQIGTGTLFAEAASAAQLPVETTLTLWPEAAPATYPATIVFDTTAKSAFGFLASAAGELLIVTGDLTAHLDRPLDASGLRIPFATTGTQAAVILLHTQASTLAFVIGAQTAQGLPELSLILENALLRTGSPTVLTATGPIRADQFGRCVVGLVFPLALIVPTLPDPYAASFTASQLAGDSGGTTAALAAVTSWNGTSAPVLSCALLAEDAAAQQPTLRLPATVTDAATGADAAPASPASEASDAAPAAVREPQLVALALLDLSTKVDLFGVAIAPLIGEYATAGPGSDLRASVQGPAATAATAATATAATAATATATTATAAAAAQAPAFALEGMSLALNGADIATFAVPQVSWEPMESTGPQGPLGPIGNPGSDGLPMLVAAPDSQQLVPFAPQPVLTNNIDNVAAGIPFAALFSLPFGLIAAISQPNGPVNPRVKSSFLAGGGTFTSLSPGFQLTAAEQLSAAVSLTLTPPGQTGAGGADPLFGGQTIVDGTYTATVMGQTPDGQSSVETIFTGEFSQGGAQQGVPLLRADLSGYGASIFSEWLNADQQGSSIIKVQFEATRGRTAFEVIQAKSVIHPHEVAAVRTITMQRQNAGWVNRSDSGWQPCSSGRFQYPGLIVHAGAILGVFNVRNIREQGAQVQYAGATYQPVLFDADIGIASTLDVTAGARSAVPAFENAPVTLTPSQDLVGYLQLLPVDTALAPDQITALVEQAGPLTPAVSCTVEAGKFGSGAGTVLRCSAVEIDVVQPSQGGDAELGIALRGAPQIPRGGGWSMGVRRYTDQAPTALPNDFPVPLVQNNNDTSLWHIADAADLDSLTQPASYYSLLHATGTNQVLFEAPQIPVAASGAGSVPGLQFPQLTTARPGGVVNPGSPNLGDLAAILNSTGLFPELSAALSLLEAGELPQINTIPTGFKYTKSYTFPSGPLTTTTIVDLGVITITLVYGDTTPQPTQANPNPAPTPAKLTYTVDSMDSPSWTLSLGTLSFQVTVPAFGPGSGPVLTITGGFYADENTKPGLTNLNVTLGNVLQAVQAVFSDLQELASMLPGGVGADLDVAVSDGALTVSDTFNIADLPLGLGQLTDISLELGLQVTLSPLSVGFLVGLGAPDNPFNWIASPLAGNGLMNFGVQQNLPAFVIQAGIGLGLSIDLGIASGSASITIAVELDVTTASIELVATLTGQASVDVLGGLASASLTLSAGLGFEVSPLPVPHITASGLQIPGVDVKLLATCSVGIHISICWVVSVSWDGSWEFSETFHTLALTV
jgi:hypothetical protein